MLRVASGSLTQLLDRKADKINWHQGKKSRLD
jgi:hypothetical protein